MQENYSIIEVLMVMAFKEEIVWLKKAVPASGTA